MLQAGRDGLPVSRMCAERLKVPRRTYDHVRKRDDDIKEAHEEYLSLLEAWFIELGQNNLITVYKNGETGINTPLYKLYMANIFGWSDKKEIDQKVDQKTSVEIVIGGGARPEQLGQGGNELLDE